MDREYNLLLFNLFLRLHKEIQRKGQQGGVLIFGAVARHQQEQQDDEQITGVEILGKQFFQKAAHTGIRLEFRLWL